MFFQQAAPQGFQFIQNPREYGSLSERDSLHRSFNCSKGKSRSSTREFPKPMPFQGVQSAEEGADRNLDWISVPISPPCKQLHGNPRPFRTFALGGYKRVSVLRAGRQVSAAMHCDAVGDRRGIGTWHVVGFCFLLKMLFAYRLTPTCLLHVPVGMHIPARRSHRLVGLRTFNADLSPSLTFARLRRCPAASSHSPRTGVLL